MHARKLGALALVLCLPISDGCGDGIDAVAPPPQQEAGGGIDAPAPAEDLAEPGDAPGLPGEGSPEPLPPLTPTGPWVRLASPGWGMRFLAPASLRLQAATEDPSSAVGAMPRRVDFYLGDRLVGTAPRDPARLGHYVAHVSDVAAGSYLVRAVATNENGTRSMGEEVLIVVEPRGRRVVRELQADIVLQGAQDLTLEGTAEARLLVVGNGRRIRSVPGWHGRLVLRRCDLLGLGTASAPAIDVAAAGAVLIEDSTFDASGQVRIAAEGAASIVVRNSELRANSLVPVLEQPTHSAPAFLLTGESSGEKRFAGNRIGLSWAAFERTAGWVIGGDSDDDVNMVWGVRGGLHVLGSRQMVLRGNYSHNTCGPGLSQCLNFELLGSPGILVEHNVVRGSAWPVRGAAGEVRYNLILDSGHSWIEGPRSGARIHHNVLAQVSGPMRYAPEQGVHVYGATDVSLENNTFDGGGAAIAWEGNVLSVASGASVRWLRSNAFVRFASMLNSPLVGGGFLERLSPPGPARLGYADYNLFYSPGNPKKIAYAISVSGRSLGQAGFGAQDLGREGEGTDPRFARAAPLPYPIRQGELWARRTRLSEVLAVYRSYYQPGAGSPLVDAGDPAGGAGNDIGAVGAGTPHAADRFGRFGGR